MNRIAAETNVTANPPSNGGINVNELSSNIIMLVNCEIIGYSEIKTIILRISLICLGIPPIQLLSNVPANIAPKPIHKIGNDPATNCPITIDLTYFQLLLHWIQLFLNQLY